MKTKLIFIAAVVLLAGAGVFWMEAHHPFASVATNSSGRKALYYTCAMHPWVRESKPGPCPVCGMNLTPVYANERGGIPDTNAGSGTVTLESETISTINVQTDIATNRPIKHMLHFSGQIVGNSSQAAWFEFTAYERDLKWFKIGQTLDVFVTSDPEKIYHAQIKLHGIKPFADSNFDMMSGSTTVRAEISNPPIEPGEFGKNKLFNGLHAEAHLVAETEPTLTIPRSAVISRGIGAMVYVDKGNCHYAPRAVELGRMGDTFVEVLAGLNVGEKVVTTGNVLIDSEAQLTAGQ